MGTKMSQRYLASAGLMAPEQWINHHLEASLKTLNLHIDAVILLHVLYSHNLESTVHWPSRGLPPLRLVLA